MPGDDPPKKPDTLRPPAPGAADEIRLPALRRVDDGSLQPVPDGPTRERPSSHPPPADPRSEGGRSFFAELVRSPIDAVGVAVPDPLPPDRQQRLDQMVHDLASCGPETDGPQRTRMLAFGPEALPALAKIFPGPVWVDLARPHRPLRTARNLSGVCAVFIAFGDEAVPYVATLLRSPRAEVRLAACLVAGDLVHGDLIHPLAARLHDEVREVRNAATVALQACSELTELKMLRTELAVTVEGSEKPADWRRRAAWTIGQLRDAELVPRLIEELGAEPTVAETVRAALVRIVGEDRGRFRFQWRRWWSKHQARDREEWLIDALDQSNLGARERVVDELVLLTGRGFELRHSVATRAGARELAEQYRAWRREDA